MPRLAFLIRRRAARRNPARVGIPAPVGARVPAGILTLVAVLCLAGGCGLSDEKAILMAAGSYGDVAVALSDESLRPVTERFLAAFNPEVTFVIKPETVFNVDVFGPDQWDTACGYKNALLLVRMGSGGALEKHAKRLVSKEAWRKMEETGGGIVQVPDPWATYQLAVVVAARDINGLGSILRNNPEKLRGIIEKDNRERILRRSRHDGLNTALMDYYRRELGFRLEIPGEFRQNQFRPDGFAGLELITNAPSRGITISWRDTDEPAAFLADAEVMVALREEMGRILHKEELVPESFIWSRDTVGDVPCVRLEGAWNSTDFDGGGPFRCWFIPDRAHGRLYCIDLLVYAPGQGKMGYFRHLEAVLSTFSTKEA